MNTNKKTWLTFNLPDNEEVVVKLNEITTFYKSKFFIKLTLSSGDTILVYEGVRPEKTKGASYEIKVSNPTELTATFNAIMESMAI